MHLGVIFVVLLGICHGHERRYSSQRRANLIIRLNLIFTLEIRVVARSRGSSAATRTTRFIRSPHRRVVSISRIEIDSIVSRVRFSTRNTRRLVRVVSSLSVIVRPDFRLLPSRAAEFADLGRREIKSRRGEEIRQSRVDRRAH
jgi:hypothetical protein